MHYEHEGMSLWYGTSDAPAPEGAIHAGTAVTATIAVKPTDASNKVELLYRRDQGTVETVTAKWLRHDISHNAQYFKARFPVFRVGDTVEYTAVCYCAGRQVPSHLEAEQLVSSFHVVATENKPTPDAAVKELMLSSKGVNGSSKDAISPVGESLEHMSTSPEPRRSSAFEASRPNGTTNPVTQPPIAMPQTTSMHLNSAMLDKSVLEHLKTNSGNNTSMEEALNAALKSRLSSAFMDNGTSTLTELVQSISPVDIAANKDVSIRAFVAKQLQGKVQRDAVLKKAVDEEVGKLSDKTTLGDLLGLDKPIKDHPLFQYEVQRVALNSLLSTSSVMSDIKLQNTFTNLYAEHDGPVQDFWDKLREQPDFKAPGTVENIQFTLQLGVLTQNNMPLVQALQGLRQQGTLQSARDLTRLDADAWTKLINTSGNVINVPAGTPGTTREEQVASYVSGMLAVLHRAFPTTYIAQELAKSPQIDLHLVRNFIALNPHINPADPLPDTLDWTGMSDADQAKAKASMESLRQEIGMFPEFDYKTALNSPVFHNPVRQAISQFFTNAPDFDLRSTSIRSYLAEHGESAFKGIDERYKYVVTNQSERMQRILQVVSNPEAVGVLLSERLDSAYSIVSMPQSTFVAHFKDKLGGEEPASQIYAQAQYLNAMAMHTFTQVHQALNDVSPMVIGSNDKVLDTIKQIPDIPDWTTLFGSLDFCDCEHCRSLYSPAAYFVDLLQFLNPKVEPATGRKPIDVLFDRRPDLPWIKLSCENTNTLIPYVDLINEILETYVVSKTTFDKSIAIDSRNPTAEELSANPQHTNVTAYTMLQSAIYPFSLPFNRSLEVARVYLEQLGSSRYEVMKVFQKNASTSGASPSDFELACEYLKLSPEECTILAHPPLPSSMPLFIFYGYSTDRFIVDGGPPRDLGGDGVFPIDPNFESWENHITHVPEFLQQTGMSYLELLELVQTRFLKITCETREGYDPCDLKNVTIKNLDEVALKKAYRFIRLWRRLGWQMLDLDRVIQALGAADIDEDFLRNLAHVVQLQGDLNIPLVQVLSLWSKIDTEGDDSLYNRLFQNKAVIKPMDPAFDVFTLNADGSELKTVSAKIVDYVHILLAALRITTADWVSLWSALKAANLPDNTSAANMLDDTSLINLANLSTLYSYTVLAKALKLSIKDLLSLIVLTTKDPFKVISLASINEFLSKVHKVQQSSFSVAQLNYLYRHLYEPNRGIAPLQNNVELLIKGLQDGLKKIVSDTVVVPDPTGDLLRRKLSIIFPDSKLADIAMKVIDGSIGSQADSAAFGIRVDPAAFIDTNFGSFLNTTEAKTKLLAGSTLSKKEERFAYVLAPLMVYLRVSLSHSFVKQTFSDALKLDTTMIDVLLETVLKSPADKTKTAMADFLALVGNGLSATYFGNQDFTGVAASRIDPTVDFSWGKEAPDPAISPGTFSARWIGKVLAQYDEVYTFYIRTSESVRLWVNNTLLFDVQNPSSTEQSGTITLQAGQLYDIKMEYSHSQSAASVQLLWSSTSTPKAIIPQGQLYSTASFSFDQPLQSYYLLYKVAMLIDTFKMTVQEVTYIFKNGSDFSNFDFNELPLDPSGFTSTLLDHWERLADFFTLRNSLPQGEVGLTDVLQAGTLDDLKSKLYAATNWDPAQIDDLSDITNGFNLATLDDFRKVPVLSRLQVCLILSKRLGVSIKHLFDWATKAPNAPQAEEIKDTVKAKYDDQEWLTVAKSLNDGLRESQRTALVAYLLQNQDMKQVLQDSNLQQSNVNDSSQLYKYFLIDVDMSACMMTSRIVQAISSVQLFVQRCLMNLEKEVSPDAIKADQWKWMKRYRVWEANRKVFLYPENWIEPELRDDKSPFFKELETELLQNEVTMDTAEQVFLNYLGKLDQVARLEICGMYWEEEVNQEEMLSDNMDWRGLNNQETSDELNILHVFARTFSIPHIYYYRKLVNLTTWTPWERVNVDIEGDHLIPVVYNRRIHLFWPIIVEKPIPPTDQQKTQPEKYLEIKLAWSEYKQNKWSTKQVSSDSEIIIVPPFINGDLLERSDLTFKARGNAQNLTIQVYFNNTPNSPNSSFDILGNFVFTGCRGRININYFSYWKVWFIRVMPQLANVNFSNSFSKDSWVLNNLDEGKYSFMMLEEKDVANGLTLDTDGFGAPTVPTLNTTPSRYDLLYPHQFQQFILQGPFFYQDDKRSYFVTPEYPSATYEQVSEPNNVVPNLKRAFVTANVISIFPGGSEPPIFETIDPITSVGGLSANSPMQPAAVKVPESDRSITKSQPITNGSRAMTVPIPVESTLAQSGILSSVVREGIVLGNDGQVDTTHLRFAPYYHPYVCDFIKALNRNGIPGLLTLENQLRSDSSLHLPKGVVGFIVQVFFEQYHPTDRVQLPYPAEDVDFSPRGAYSLYNWELFFHIPMLIATRLSKNQRFEEAQQWFHYIFNPTDSSSEEAPKRYWKVLPFQATENERIQDLLALLHYTGYDPQILEQKKQLDKQVQEWRANPFNPHLIARLRLIAYQKNVVMKYIDNLIAWGDQLFAQDTLESINEATQLYILAHEMLGPRPERIPALKDKPAQTYKEIQPYLDSFSNALVTLETYIFHGSKGHPVYWPNIIRIGSPSSNSLGSWPTFCIPQNEQLLGYWDTVADRLFKIRHCMNIEGVVRQLPLFAPPIDPALLVQAAAMGVDLGSVLNDINAAKPHYRFTYMLQQALELCNDLKALGSSLLSALEKKDAEALAYLRASQETNLLKAVRKVKEQQLEEANTNLEALQKTLDVTTFRCDFYETLIKQDLIDYENTQLSHLSEANDHQKDIADNETIGQYMNLLPNISVGFAPANVSLSFGGSNIGAFIFASTRKSSSQVSDETYQANKSGLMGGFSRRRDEWNLQQGLAMREVKQINQQIAAGKIRAVIAQQELDNHDKQIENTAAVEEFLHDKYTNQELYEWMIGQISAVYFQSYRMVYDIAKRTERAYQFERGLSTSDYIKFGYWDGLKKGLWSGEQLYLDLKRLEMAYIDQNKREYEITKHISMVMHDPMALIALKETGKCQVHLPEELFDMDYPGHYMRRIKSVSLTIPCVIGPYTSINCTLTLMSNKIRIDSNSQGDYVESMDGEDTRFLTSFGAVESIATSTAQNDSGMFEVNFRDERYLPFEGAGVVSTWQIDMPKDCNAFDFETISDVIIKLNYTARDGGMPLCNAAKAAAKLPLPPNQPANQGKTPFLPQDSLLRMFSARHEFSNEWYRFLHPTYPASNPTADPTQTLTLDLSMERFPFQFRGRTFKINAVNLFLKLNDGFAYDDGNPLAFVLTKDDNTQLPGSPSDKPLSFSATKSSIANLPFVEPLQGNSGGLGTWSIGVKESYAKNLPSSLPSLQRTVTVNGQNYVQLNPDAFEDIWIVCQYSVG